MDLHFPSAKCFHEGNNLQGEKDGRGLLLSLDNECKVWRG